MLFLCSISTYGTDLFVYPNAQSPDYSDIQSAIDASNDGDNIYIDTAQFIGNININKTLSLYPLHKGGMYTINGAVTLSLINNRTIYIQGLNGGGVSSSFFGNYTDSASVILNGCEFSSSVSINYAYTIRSFIYYSTFNSDVNLDACELIGNTFNGQVNIYPNQAQFAIPPSIKIYANNISIDGGNGYNANKVIIENNIFKDNYTSYYDVYQVLVNYADFLFIRNNYFDVHTSYTRGVTTSGIDIYDFQYNFSNTSSSNFSEGFGTIQTIANNTYSTYLSYGYTSQNSLGNVTSNQGQNVGSQLPECRDIDNTQNDIGTFGGPHSWSNYHNSSTSMAQILDLDIPYYQIVLPGTVINFNSKAIHKNE